MKRFALAVCAMSVSAAFAAATIPGDARRGAELFQAQKCVACHSVDGKGGTSAPDLAKRTGRSYSPALLTSLMWNHAPAMWPAMEKAGIGRPQLTEQQSADLFAYFYAFRYFEKAGDAARGRLVFTAKNCAICHGLDRPVEGGGPPVATWRSLTDSIELARAMWTHAAGMREAMAKRKLDWPVVSAQELTDLVVYLRNAPGAKPGVEQFNPAAADTGAQLFQAKGCATCHRGSLALESRLRARSMADLAASMWNHAPKMIQFPPELSSAEMQRLVGYLWSIQFFDERGSASRGEKVFAAKKCAVCHNDPSSGAPSLKGRDLNAISMASALWSHGPTMLAKMREKKLPWPRFDSAELNDLLAFLNAKR